MAPWPGAKSGDGTGGGKEKHKGEERERPGRAERGFPYASFPQRGTEGAIVGCP